ncbi:hypothetical protein D3C73_1192490 [compost metagenome]
MVRELCASKPATGTTPRARGLRFWSRLYLSAITAAEMRESILPAPISSARDRTAKALTVPDWPAAVSLKDSRNRTSEAWRCLMR